MFWQKLLLIFFLGSFFAFANNSIPNASNKFCLAPHSSLSEEDVFIERLSQLIDSSSNKIQNTPFNGLSYAMVDSFPFYLKEGKAFHSAIPGETTDFLCSVNNPKNLPLDVEVWTNLPDGKSHTGDWYEIPMSRIEKLPLKTSLPEELSTLEIYRLKTVVPNIQGSYGFSIRIKESRQSKEFFKYESSYQKDGQFKIEQGPVAETWKLSDATEKEVPWFKQPKTYMVMILPGYYPRRAEKDPGISKFKDWGERYVKDWSKYVDVIQMLPFLHILSESPYAPVSDFALNENFIDWSDVRDVSEDEKELLYAGPEELKKVNYDALREREEKVALAAYERFLSTEAGKNTSYAQDYQKFCQQHKQWLDDFSEFMALHEILNKNSLEWTAQETSEAKQNKRYELLYGFHQYAQWHAYTQFKRDFLDPVHEQGGKIWYDQPMFTNKDSVSVWKKPADYLEPKNPDKYPGIVMSEWGVNERWTELALRNWTQLKEVNYSPVLDAHSHWLEEGCDGGRLDALHLAYNDNPGQLKSGDEPGAEFVNALADVFKKNQKIPFAEAFEGKNFLKEISENMVTLEWGGHGNVMVLSTHDSPRFNSKRDFSSFFWNFNSKEKSGSYNREFSKFILFTAGDEICDPEPVKVVTEDAKGRHSYWHSREKIPSENPELFSEGSISGIKQFLTAYKNLRDSGNIWNASDAVQATLENAAQSFVKKNGDSYEIWAASWDWFFQQWGRDTFISLPGILLTRGKFEEARNIFRNFARFEKKGVIPNRVWDPSKPETIEYNNADGSMWFIRAIYKYVEYTQDWEFAKEMLPTLRSIVLNYSKPQNEATAEYQHMGHSFKIYMDSDGLIVSPAQGTWMDAQVPGAPPVTPRNGKACEINATWCFNLQFLAFLENKVGDPENQKDLLTLASKVKDTYRKKFWNEANGCLNDVVDGDPYGNEIRPNMMFALALGSFPSKFLKDLPESLKKELSKPLLSIEQQKSILDVVHRHLLTPYGLRTLSPVHTDRYKSRYHTQWEPKAKDWEYHQGTVWPWLMGPYLEGLINLRKQEGKSPLTIQAEVKRILTPLIQFLMSNEALSLPEVFDGGDPKDPVLYQNPGGTRSQAWSIAEVYRILVETGIMKTEVQALKDIDNSIITLAEQSENQKAA